MGGRRGGSKKPPVVKDNWSLTGPRGQYGLGEGVSGPPGVTNGAWLPGSQYGGPAPGGQPPMGGQRMGKTPARGGQPPMGGQRMGKTPMGGQPPMGGQRMGKTPKSGITNPQGGQFQVDPSEMQGGQALQGGQQQDFARMQAQQDMMGQMANALRMGGQ